MSKKRLDDLKAYIHAQGWRWQPGKIIQYGEQIIVTAGSAAVPVNFYPKREKLVVGGSNSPLKTQLLAWVEGETQTGTPVEVSRKSAESPIPSSNRLDALKGFIHAQGWNWGPGATIAYGEQIIVSDAGVTAQVNFWPKHEKMQVQGRNSHLRTALQAWINGEVQIASDANGEVQTTFDASVADVTDSHTGNALMNAGPHIGMDETGKGDWFGPLVVAAVYVDAPTAAELRRLGVRDSKALSAAAIQRLAGHIERLVPSAQRNVWAMPMELYNQRYSHDKNISILLADVYAQVAQPVYEATQAACIVCDQFSQKKARLEDAFARKGLPKPVQHHHAEDISVAVAAASILASVAFTDAMAQLGANAGLEVPLPKGASDIDALEATFHHILDTKGRDALAHYAKLHFKPIRKLLGEQNPAVSAAATPGTVGPPVMLETEAWHVQYHPGGFWRYTFQDGGYLDWWDGSAKGTIYVHGKPGAESVRILKPKTEGRTWQGEREKMDQAVENYIPRYGQREIPSVLGIGWDQRKTVLGARFDFGDGAVLNYYTGKDDKGKLLIQGKPSRLTEAALTALPNPFWKGLDALNDTLKQLFPDWKLGQPSAHSDDMEEGAMPGTGSWTPLDNAFDWQRMKPGDKALREAIHEGAPCQKALIKDWASVLAHHQDKAHLLAHAPTGLGKTLAALIPALAWVAEAPNKRSVYYLVNRVAQHNNPLRELKSSLATLFEQHAGQPLRVVDLVGRGLLCHYPRARALPDTCREARDSASFDLLPSTVSSWQEVQAHLGRRACPYHTLQGLMAQAHVVICDYWWLFSPAAQRGGAHFPSPAERAGFSSTDSILIVDEAHNLVPRVRSWLDVDAVLTDVERAVQRASSNVQRCLLPVLDVLKTVQLETGLMPSALLARAGGTDAVQAALEALEQDEDLEQTASIPERLLRLLCCPDETAVIYAEADWQTQARRLVGRLVDPTAWLQTGFGRVYASLSMSGTLSAPADNETELSYQVPLLGLPVRETLARKYASPFPLRHQRWIYCPDTIGVSKKRNQYLAKYADHIINVGQATPGVTVVFFSSYTFLKKVHAALQDSVEQALVVCETRADAAPPDTPSGLKGYEQRLRDLVDERGRAYLFAIYAGKLSEGADFKGNLIKSVICISIPMEYPKLFHDRLQALYVRRFAEIAEGFGDDPIAKACEYALDRLSLSLVLQACGRGIRSEQDRCAFVLLDKRYHEYDWRRFLEPRPYHVRRVEQAFMSFYNRSTTTANGEWDEALVF